MKGYARIWRRLWDDEKFRSLGPYPEQWTVLYLLSYAANRIGIFNPSIGDLAERLDVKPSQAAELVGRICGVMEWGWEPDARTLWIESWWRWNPPESPKALMGYLRELRDLPESKLRTSYIRANHGFTDSLREAYRKAIDSLTARARVRAQTYPEPEPEPEEESLSSQRSTENQSPAGGPEAGNGAGWPDDKSQHPKPEPATPTPGFRPGLLDELQARYPKRDVAAIAEKVLERAKIRPMNLDTALLGWVRTAERKDTDRRPDPPAVAITFAEQLARRLEPLSGLLTKPQLADLEAKATAEHNRGTRADIVLWARMGEWIRELLGDKAPSATREFREPAWRRAPAQT